MSGILQSPKSISAAFQSQTRKRKPDRRKPDALDYSGMRQD